MKLTRLKIALQVTLIVIMWGYSTYLAWSKGYDEGERDGAFLELQSETGTVCSFYNEYRRGQMDKLHDSLLATLLYYRRIAEKNGIPPAFRFLHNDMLCEIEDITRGDTMIRQIR